MSLQKWTRKKGKAASDGDLEQLYQSCLELARIYMNEDEHESALREYKEAKRAGEATNKTVYVAHAHRAIADVYNVMLNHELAIKHGRKHLELARLCNDVAEEQRALANLGHLYHSKADTFSNSDSQERLEALAMAKEYSLKSLQVCDKLTNISKKELYKMKAGACLNIGLAVEQQDQDEALSYYNKAVGLCKSMDIWDTLYRTYFALGSLFLLKASHARALEYLDKALDAAQRLHDNQSVCHILLLKADILFDLPNFGGAKQCLLKAYKLNTTNRNEVEKKLRTVAAVKHSEEKLLDTPDCDLVTKKSLYETLGDGCASLKNYKKALEYYNLMLETAQTLGESGERLRPCLVSLSQTYKDNKQYDLAIKYLTEELKLNDNNPLEASKTTLNIADVLDMNGADHEEVLAMIRQARNLAQTSGNFKMEARALSEAIRVMKKTNLICDARKMEAELEKMRETNGPLSSSSESEEEENSLDIGADICIDDLSDAENESSAKTSARVRKKPASTNFKRNEKGEFPLHVACINGNLTLVKKLLDQGHPVNVRDHSGWLPLHEACNYGYLDIVEVLLDKGAAINDRGTETVGGMTPLMDAASCGNLDVMQLLLARGASPVMRNNKRESALDCLIDWRKRYIQDMKRDLDSATMKQFDELKTTLAAALKKSGQSADVEQDLASPPSPILCGNSYSGVSVSRSLTEKSSQQLRSKSCLRRSTNQIEEPPSTSRSRYSDRESVPSSSSSERSEFRPTHHSTQGAKEYEEAMKSLRRKSAQVHRSNSPPMLKQKAALVSEEEALVSDDWLVDDLGGSAQANRGIKRRRVHQFQDEPLRQTSRPFTPPPCHGFRPLSPINTAISSDSNDSQLNQPMEADSPNEALVGLAQLLQSDDLHVQQQPRPELSTSSSRAYQLPLSAFGVVRSTEPRQSAQPPPQMQAQTCATAALKVRVKDKLLLIPLPTVSENPLTIAWLAQEAAKRYYSFEGMEPELTLSTHDGALLAPQDPVTLLLGSPEVKAEVTRWKQHSVTQRYREACNQLNLDVDEYLERCLDVCQPSLTLDLAGCELVMETVTPVLRASAHFTSLQTLVLRDNRVGDVGMQLVVGVVTKLPHLRELDLSGNGITSEGLSCFVQQVIEHESCKRLEVLRLCHNRLGKSCVSLLSRLFPATCPALRELSLTCVSLDHTSFDGLPVLPIEKLEAGHNSLEADGVTELLRTLNVSRVEVLRLPHCGASVPGKVAQWLTSGGPCLLRTLDLAHCFDQSDAFTRLWQCLENASQLEHLELSCPEIKDCETIQVLHHLPRLRVLRLPGVPVCPNVLPVIPLTLQFSCVSHFSTVPVGWSRGPFGYLTNTQA